MLPVLQSHRQIARKGKAATIPASLHPGLKKGLCILTKHANVVLMCITEQNLTSTKLNCRAAHTLR